MKSYFESHFFAANRKELRKRFTGTAPIVMTANGLLQRGADSSYAFSQDANFWYLTGIDEPDILLVMDADQEYLIVPSRSDIRQSFDGAVDHGPLTKRSGIKTVYNDTEGWEKLGARLKKTKHVATVAAPPAYVEHFGLYTNPARAELARKLQENKKDVEIVDIGQDLARMRMIKQQPELKAIQQAIDITEETLETTTTLNMLSNYRYEFELEAGITAGFRRRGADGNAFEPIVAGGKNACTLHNMANNDRLKAGNLVLTDVGAEVQHYAADITRVYSLSKPTARQKAVYAAVLEVQQFALGQLKPGVLPKEYEQTVEHFMGQKLQQLKLIKDSTHENIRKYYPHSTSHFLGLNVHDVGDYTAPLEPGIVMTVEPGIYIPEESLGVRIEDDILITAKGNQVLSDKISRKLR